MATSDLTFQCRCGKVKGRLEGASPKTGSRLVCYCDDCQAYQYFLGREVDYLDAHGGTDIFQTTPARFVIEEGAENTACVQMTPKRVYRWHTSCCQTPLANTAGSRAFPFVGAMVGICDPMRRDAALGPVRGHVYRRYARGDLGNAETANLLSLIVAMLVRAASVRLAGATRDNPFFNHESGAPVAKPKILSTEERAAIGARMLNDVMRESVS